jgi:hypothetical protein
LEAVEVEFLMTVLGFTKFDQGYERKGKIAIS